MSLTTYIQITVVTLIWQACLNKKDCNDTIIVVNGSNGDLAVMAANGEANGLTCRQVPALIKPGERFTYNLLHDCWEPRINNFYKGTVDFYFFDENYFDTHSACDSVEFNQSVIEKRKYTVADLNAINWVISYP